MDIKRVYPTTSSGANMTEQQALLASVITSPDDDTPRLVYADFLQDQPTHTNCTVCRGTGILLMGGRGNGDTFTPSYKTKCSYCDGDGKVPSPDRKLGEYIKLSLELYIHKKLMTPRKDEKIKEIEYRNDMQHIFPDSYKWYQRGIELREQINTIWLQAREHISFSFLLEKKYANAFSPFEVDRGFINSITCTASQFLSVCDKLIWHPSIIDKCENCKGNGFIAYHSEGECLECGHSGVIGTGRIARPCPFTAHPVREVGITDPLTTYSRFGDFKRPHDKDFWVSDKWKGIKFTLTEPPYTHMVQLDVKGVPSDVVYGSIPLGDNVGIHYDQLIYTNVE